MTIFMLQRENILMEIHGYRKRLTTGGGKGAKIQRIATPLDAVIALFVMKVLNTVRCVLLDRTTVQ